MLGWGQLSNRAIGYIGTLPREFARPYDRAQHRRSAAAVLARALAGLAVPGGAAAPVDLCVHLRDQRYLRLLYRRLSAARAAGRLRSWPSRRWLARLPVPGARVIAAGALLAILALGVWPRLAPRWPDVRAGRIPFVGVENYPADVQSENLYRSVVRVVDQLPPNAIVFADWNQLYMYIYAAYIDQGRLDLRFIEPAPRADKQGLPDLGDRVYQRKHRHTPDLLHPDAARGRAGALSLPPARCGRRCLYEVRR